MSTKISELSVLGASRGTDEVVLRRGDLTGRMALSALFAALADTSALADLAARVTALEAHSGIPTPGVLTVRFGTSDDDVPSAAELSIEAEDGVGEVLAYAGEKHLVIGRLATEPDVTSVLFSDDTSQTNQIGAFTRASGVVGLGGQDWAVWVSNQLLTQSADLGITVA